MLTRPPGLSPPSRDDVLAQGVRFEPAPWRRLLPGSVRWPAQLDSANVVTRETVFAICQGDDVTRSLVAVCVQGAGTDIRSVHRRLKVFTHNEPGVLGFRLAAALEVLRDTGPVAAYAALCGRLRLSYLGPATFTRFLYFAGYEPAQEPRPLILDRFVVRGLRADWPAAEWTSAQYGEYLRHVHTWAHETDSAPDAVEMALSEAGRS